MNEMVDVLIATVGRPSLAQAILAALRQSWSPAPRVVVVGDGRQPAAERIVECLAPFSRGQLIYRETPAHHGFGDPVKEWWINGDEAAPFTRILDDDDWMPPVAVAEMMAPMAADVAAVACSMFVHVAPHGRWQRERIQRPSLAPGQIGWGSLLFRTAACRGVPWPRQPHSDFRVIQQIARAGRVVCLSDRVLYWYAGHRRWAKNAAGEWERKEL